MKEYALKSDNFSLVLSLEIFESDIKYPINTTMTVAVESNGFCGMATMDIDIKEMKNFSECLNKLYSSLKGKATIKEPYGHNQFLEFEGDGIGHILVRGKLIYDNEFFGELKFENMIDQTILKNFVKQLPWYTE